MAPGTLPSQAYLRECFDYDMVVGSLHWRTRPRAHFCSDRVWRMWNTNFTGKRCGSPQERGYLRVKLDGHPLFLHRIIWKWMTGEDPILVDHRDHKTDKNWWGNLRNATVAQNTHHMHGHKDRKFPGALKGAYRHKAGWLSFVGIDGKQRYLGVFKTEIEAHERYVEEAKLLHGDFMGPLVTN